ncbi:MAG: POTRA domain-containing protein [Bryobacteraceae bacterium]
MGVLSIVLLNVLLVCASPAYSQNTRARKPAAAKPSAEKAAATPEPSANAWPIGSLQVEGNKIYSNEQILTAAGLKLGQLAGKDEFEAARDRIIATGAFESVGYRFGPSSSGTKEFAASFQVIEIAQVFAFRFESLTVGEAELRDFLKRKEPLFDRTIPGTKEVLARVSKEAEEFVAKSGHPEGIAAKLMGERGKELTVVFGPTTLPSVAEVKFAGNEVISKQTLQMTIAGVAVGAVYSEARFQQILDNTIRPLYEAKGKIRVKFPKLNTEKAKDVDGLIVTVTVVEGPTYKLGAVTLTGAPSAATLVKEAKFKTGEPANFTEIDEAADRIRTMVRHGGYLLVKSETERKIDDKENKVDLVIHVERGAMYTFGKLSIEGLDIIGEPQIRKLWIMKPGAPFDGEYPALFLSRLKEGGYFDNLGKTKSNLDIDEKNRIVDVKLLFASDGKAPPAIGPERDEQEKRERRKQQQQW